MRLAQGEMRRTQPSLRNPAPALIDVNANCQSIVVNAPVAEVYRCCLHVEDFPRFITSIKKVKKINDTRFSCTSMVDGKEVKSEVMIMMRAAARRIAWQAGSDQFRIGVVLLDPLDDATTKVTVKVRSMIKPVLLTGELRNHLGNFKRYIEHDLIGNEE
jgi:uncharacterized membrane protein